MTYAEQILKFNAHLELRETLPNQIEVLNPFQGENAAHIWPILEAFYGQFYNDTNQRTLILGINPGRLGAGSTGLPFTDTKRLNADCGIPFEAFTTHEPSSVFVYDVIRSYGGPDTFYRKFYISSICPLGFVKPGKKGMVNINYYDDKALEKAVTPFIIESLNKQIEFGLRTDVVYILGTGKNYKFFSKLNTEHHFFDKVVPLEHPRFVMQYRLKRKMEFIEKYIQALGS